MHFLHELSLSLQPKPGRQTPIMHLKHSEVSVKTNLSDLVQTQLLRAVPKGNLPASLIMLNSLLTAGERRKDSSPEKGHSEYLYRLQFSLCYPATSLQSFNPHLSATSRDLPLHLLVFPRLTTMTPWLRSLQCKKCSPIWPNLFLHCRLTLNCPSPLASHAWTTT